MQNELQNEEDDDERSSVQTRYFQNMMKPVLEAHQVVKKLEKPNPLKSKKLTVEKR